MSDLVTVFTSCHNQARFLEKSIQSILNQTHKNFEYLLYDDGSTDETWQIISKYAAIDSRIKAFKLEKQPNVGVVINKSIREAKGKFWVWCPADDICLPELLEKKYTCSKQYGHKAILYSDWYHINDKDEIIGEHTPIKYSPEEFREVVWKESPIGFTGIWVPIYIFKLVGLFPEHLKYSEDFYWMIKSTIHGVDYIGIPEKLYMKRLHDNRLTKKYYQEILENVSKIRNDLRAYRSSLQTIPKRIFFFWGNDEISWLRFMILKSFKMLNPDWEIVLYRTAPKYQKIKTWSSAEDQDFFYFNGVDYSEELKKLGIKIVDWKLENPLDPSDESWTKLGSSHQSNFLKWQILGTEGGIYADMDILFIRPIDQLYELLNNNKVNSAICYTSYFSIGFMASTPGNRFFFDLYLNAFKTYTPERYQCVGVENLYDLLMPEGFRADEGSPDWNLIAQTDLWSRLVAKYPGNNFYNIPMYVVYPWTSENIREVFESSIAPEAIPAGSIGIHWYAGDLSAKKWNQIFTSKNYRDYDNTLVRAVTKFLDNNPAPSRKGADPFFSVVVPTYNQAEYLGETLESLFAQTFQNWEALVVNDGSTDNTAEVMNRYAAKDPRIRLFHKENGGVATALNVGIKNARGKWICWLSSDDLFEPDKLQIQYEAILQHPQIKFFYTHFYYLDDKTKEKGTPDLWVPIPQREFQVTQFLLGNYVNGISIACHRSLFQKVGYFNTTMRQAQDYDMWLRITSKFESMFINRRTCVTRFHPDQDTNAFVDGMYYDSARSAIEFLNKAKFPEIFPLLDLTNPNQISIAIDNALKTALNTSAFMYRCGYFPILIDRLNEWISNDCPVRLRDSIRSALKKFVNEKIPKEFPEELTEAFQRLVTNKSFTFTEYDFYENSLKTIDKLIKQGEQKVSKNLERYLQILFTKRETKQLPFVRHNQLFISKIFGYSENGKLRKVPYSNLLSWKIKPLSYEGLFKHIIKIKCSQCEAQVLLVDKIEARPEETSIEIVCPECHRAYEIVDSEIHKYLLENNRTAQIPKNSSNRPKVAFITRGIDKVSGGTKIYSKYMQWMYAAGLELLIVSDSPKGSWFDPPGEFVQVKDFEDADLSDADYAFVYCILDIPKIADKIRFERIIYVCQAYEGFLYGQNFELMRTDKAIFNSLHSLPINVISVSTHLHDFFIQKKQRSSILIRNFINTRVFKPNSTIKKIKNSILFVGNPFQPLKGLHYLLAAIRGIQKEFTGSSRIKLYVATGVATKQMENDFEKIKRVVDADVLFMSSLSDEKMSELINSCEVYVCASWYEGFSLSILEAMACGTPLISTRNYGAESFCADGINSFLVDYGDVKALSGYLFDILKHNVDLKDIISNGIKTAKEFKEENTRQAFYQNLSTLLNTKLEVAESKCEEEELMPDQYIVPKSDETAMQYSRKLEITYLISNIMAATGGNQTLLQQANELVRRGHHVTIVTYSKRPSWFNLQADVRTIPQAENMYKYVPKSDVVISTYFENAKELRYIDSPVKVYFNQGDQYLFDDPILKNDPRTKLYFDEMKRAFGIEDVKLIVNSNAIAKIIFDKFGRKPDEILNIGIDTTVFRPLQKTFKGSRKRILVVGPDTKGTSVEPLLFKGMLDVKEALLEFKKINPDFTLVRISNTEPEIFKDSGAEFYFLPNNEMKRFLYGTADVLIYPSHYESWGLPPLEAMAAGTAVICTSNIGSMEYCRHEENCLLVPVKSPKDIVEALTRLFDDEELYRKIISGGLFTMEKYTKIREWNKLEEILYDYVGQKDKSIFLPNDDCKMTDNDAIEILRKANHLLESGQIESSLVLLQNLNQYLKESNNTELKETYFELAGLVLIYNGKEQEAKECYENLLNINPSSSVACWGLGQILLAENNFEAAKTMFEWAVKNGPSNQMAIEGLSNVNRLLGLEAAHNSLLIEAGQQ